MKSLEPRDHQATTREVLDSLAHGRLAEAPCVRCSVPTTHFQMGTVAIRNGAAVGWTREAKCLVCVVGRHLLDVLDYRAAHPDDPMVQQITAARPDDGSQRVTVESLIARMEAARAHVAGAAGKDAALAAALWEGE